MPITRPFVEKSRPRLLIFTSTSAYPDALSPEDIAAFIEREWKVS